MGEAVSHSLQYLDQADVAALIGYLRTVAARPGQHPVDVDAQAAPALAAADDAPAAGSGAQSPGLRLFEGACASCHQWNGKGQQSPYAGLLGTRGVNDVSGANVTRVILEGGKLRIGESDVFMPAFGDAYSNTEVAALANYVIAQFGAKQGRVTPDEVAKRRAM